MDLPLPPATRYDQAGRYLLLAAGARLFSWLFAGTKLQLRFERWLPTQLTLPGVTQRLCDGIAALTDQGGGGLPCAAILEVQTNPDATMPGRLLLAGGLLWLTVKPTPLPGDRYQLLAVVVNLTGKGDAAHQCVLDTAEWTLRPREVNLGQLDAGQVLDQIEAGAAPRELLAFIPLMQRGGEKGIIDRWRALVAAETDLKRRGDYALALVFAERVGRDEDWRDAVEGFAMIESPLIAELLTEARNEAARTAKTEGKTEALLRVLGKRYGEVPEELATSIRACRAGEQLDRWLDIALEAQALEEFRQQTGL